MAVLQWRGETLVEWWSLCLWCLNSLFFKKGLDGGVWWSSLWLHCVLSQTASEQKLGAQWGLPALIIVYQPCTCFLAQFQPVCFFPFRKKVTFHNLVSLTPLLFPKKKKTLEFSYQKNSISLFYKYYIFSQIITLQGTTASSSNIRKLVYPEKTHADTGRTCRFHCEGLRPFLLWGDSQKHCTTVWPPQIKLVSSLLF